MSLMILAGALLGIVVLAIVVNRITGTTANYIDALRLAPGETELWRDIEADVARMPRLGRALFMSFPRLRAHTVVWTDRRVVISRKALLSAKRMITHQVHFQHDARPEALAASEQALGGFFGRGFETIIAASRTFNRAEGKSRVAIKPTEECAARLNLDELLIFTDRLAELEARLSLIKPPLPVPAA